MSVNVSAGLGMTSADFVVEHYHSCAAGCWLCAKQKHNAKDKLALIELASSWLLLADWVESNEPLFTPFEESKSEWRC
jgi:hypothetical protein